MSLKYVLVKSGSSSVIASRTRASRVILDTHFATALFDVGSCFEALSEYKRGHKVVTCASFLSDHPF